MSNSDTPVKHTDAEYAQLESHLHTAENSVDIAQAKLDKSREENEHLKLMLSIEETRYKNLERASQEDMKAFFRRALGAVFGTVCAAAAYISRGSVLTYLLGIVALLFPAFLFYGLFNLLTLNKSDVLNMRIFLLACLLVFAAGLFFCLRLH